LPSVLDFAAVTEWLYACSDEVRHASNRAFDHTIPVVAEAAAQEYLAGLPRGEMGEVRPVLERVYALPRAPLDLVPWLPDYERDFKAHALWVDAVLFDVEKEPALPWECSSWRQRNPGYPSDQDGWWKCLDHLDRRRTWVVDGYAAWEPIARAWYTRKLREVSANAG